MRNWKKRWFVIIGQFMYYYESEQVSHFLTLSLFLSLSLSLILSSLSRSVPFSFSLSLFFFSYSFAHFHMSPHSSFLSQAYTQNFDPMGVIPLIDCSVLIAEKMKKPFCFEISTRFRSLSHIHSYYTHASTHIPLKYPYTRFFFLTHISIQKLLPCGGE